MSNVVRDNLSLRDELKQSFKEINRLENLDPRSFEDVRVYVGDSFNDPANARYKNLQYENIDDQVTIGKGYEL